MPATKTESAAANGTDPSWIREQLHKPGSAPTEKSGSHPGASPFPSIRGNSRKFAPIRVPIQFLPSRGKTPEFEGIRNETRRNRSDFAAKINHRLHTDAIQARPSPAEVSPKQAAFTYASRRSRADRRLAGKGLPVPAGKGAAGRPGGGALAKGVERALAPDAERWRRAGGERGKMRGRCGGDGGWEMSGWGLCAVLGLLGKEQVGGVGGWTECGEEGGAWMRRTL